MAVLSETICIGALLISFGLLKFTLHGNVLEEHLEIAAGPKSNISYILLVSLHTAVLPH